MQKKWVELFEKVIGRKPSPEEFMAGKACGFDLKQIRSIAGNTPVEEVAPVEELEVKPVEEVKNVDPLLAARQAWLQHFEETYGRKPSAEEFTAAKSQNFEFFVGPVPEAEFATPDSTEETQEYVAQEPTQEYTAPLATEQTQVYPEANFTEALPAQEKQKAPKKQKTKSWKKGSKKKIGIIAALILLVIALVATFFYFQSTTRVEVTADQFIKAVDTKDYREAADLLSTDSDKWTKDEAESFITSMEDQGIDIGTELNKIIDDGGEGTYTDKSGNKIFGLEKADKKFGIFQEYRVSSYPIHVKVKTNLDQAKLKVADNKTLTLKKDEVTDLGSFHYNAKEMELTAKTEVGNVTSKIHLNPKKATKNALELQLNSEKRNLEVEFPEEVENPTDVKVVVNGKEVGISTTFEVDSIPYQEIEVHAVFNMNGETYTTEKAKVTIEEGENDPIELKLAKDTLKRIKSAQDAKKAQAAKEEQNRTLAEEFLKEYRDAVFSSVSNRNNTYSKYYDTQSQAYKDMVEFTTGDGVRKAKIDYYTPGALDIQSVTEENGVVTIKTYEDFTVHYTDSHPDSQNRKYKTYTLKKVGASYVITDIVVTKES
ncbi:TcaA second domain-containing protein [Streptococcus sp. OMI870]|uniref:TcaA second domain-containing protein n=1 Tax=Streptococcus sp. OMI870 TaxID=3047018 RepID=UPI0039C28AAF